MISLDVHAPIGTTGFHSPKVGTVTADTFTEAIAAARKLRRPKGRLAIYHDKTHVASVAKNGHLSIMSPGHRLAAIDEATA